MKFILIPLLMVIATVSSAEPLQKHPRVAELEDTLRDGASVYLRSRFPDRPFLVTASVDPLRRITGKNSEKNTDLLPYFDASSEEIQDEWDDPQTSLHQLVGRVNKIIINISIENALSDQEAQEVKDALRGTLHLIDARDEIQFAYKNWSKSGERWLYPLMALGISILFLFGFYAIQKTGITKLSQALGQRSSNASAGSVTSQVPQSTGGSRSESANSVKGGVQLSDPIKAREITAGLVKRACELPVFPTLSALLFLEKFGKEHPAGLGALITEFPLEQQKTLYSLGNEEVWFTALNEPGTIGMTETEILQKLIKDSSAARSANFERMLISVWRLGDQISDFIREFPREQALSVLQQLPKGLGIRAARKAFPGAWADLLNPDFKAVAMSETQVDEILKKAQKLKPLGNFENFQAKRAEKELQEYLTVSSPEEEREIYLASRSDSPIHKMRPPFYKVLEAEEKDLPDFCGKFTPDQWAYALFNVDRHFRKKLQTHMGEKQSFLLMEHIKRLDQSVPDPLMVGRTRELIASQFGEFLISRQIEADTKANAPESEVDDDLQKAA
jgi:hypothetical protein